MKLKEFFKLSISKIILTIILGIIISITLFLQWGCAFSRAPSFVCNHLRPILFMIFDYGWLLGAYITGAWLGVAWIVEGIYFYIISCIVMGFFSSIKNKESLKTPIIALVILILVVVGSNVISFNVISFMYNLNKENKYFESKGFLPGIKTIEECQSKGYYWNNNVRMCHQYGEKECKEKGYKWLSGYGCST